MNATDKPTQLWLDAYIDDRGYLCQVFGTYERLFSTLKRVYVICNFETKTVRGLHRHKNESKAYFVAEGSAKFVVAGSKGKPITFVLSAKKPSLLMVPPGHFHGWRALQNGTILLGLSDKTLAESQADDERANPYKFGKHVWEVESR